MPILSWYLFYERTLVRQWPEPNKRACPTVVPTRAIRENTKGFLLLCKSYYNRLHDGFVFSARLIFPLANRIWKSNNRASLLKACRSANPLKNNNRDSRIMRKLTEHDVFHTVSGRASLV